MADFAQIGDSPDYPVDPKPLDNSANFMTPYKLNTGVTRGTQTISNTDGSKVYIGKIPNTDEFGIAFTDTSGNIISQITGSTYSFFDISGNLVSEIAGPTQYIYDLTTNKNVIQIGRLPDGSYGLCVAKTGFDVSDGF